MLVNSFVHPGNRFLAGSALKIESLDRDFEAVRKKGENLTGISMCILSLLFVVLAVDSMEPQTSFYSMNLCIVAVMIAIMFLVDAFFLANAEHLNYLADKKFPDRKRGRCKGKSRRKLA